MYISTSEVLISDEETTRVRAQLPDGDNDIAIWSELCIGALLKRPLRRSRANPKPLPVKPEWIEGFTDSKPDQVLNKQQ